MCILLLFFFLDAGQNRHKLCLQHRWWSIRAQLLSAGGALSCHHHHHIDAKLPKDGRGKMLESSLFPWFHSRRGEARRLASASKIASRIASQRLHRSRCTLIMKQRGSLQSSPSFCFRMPHCSSINASPPPPFSLSCLSKYFVLMKIWKP